MTNTKSPAAKIKAPDHSEAEVPRESNGLATEAEVRAKIERMNHLLSLPLKTPTSHPRARADEGITAVDVLDEHVVYDNFRHEVHSLNPTAAQVWRWCDGRTSAGAMTKRLGEQHALPRKQAKALLHLTFDRLEKARLLEARVQRPVDAQSVTRRQVMGYVPVALLPVIASMIAPTAAAAASGCTCIDVSGGFGACGPAGACGTGSGTCYANSDCTLPVSTTDCVTCDGSSNGSWLKL